MNDALNLTPGENQKIDDYAELLSKVTNLRATFSELPKAKRAETVKLMMFYAHMTEDGAIREFFEEFAGVFELLENQQTGGH